MITYGFTEEQYIAAIHDRMKCLGVDDQSETDQIADMREDIDESGLLITDNIKSLDAEIIKDAKKIGEVVNGYDEEFWAWNLDKVACGSFPVDKLPLHVRDLATKLYYGAGA